MLKAIIIVVVLLGVLGFIADHDPEYKSKEICADAIKERYSWADFEPDWKGAPGHEDAISAANDDGSYTAILQLHLDKKDIHSLPAYDSLMFYNNHPEAGWKFWKCTVRDGKAININITNVSAFDQLYDRIKKK